jgi:hypothetical protein
MSKKDKDNCLTPFTNELSTMEWSSQWSSARWHTEHNG